MHVQALMMSAIPTSAPPALVAHTGAGLGPTGGTTSAINTTGATFLAVSIAAQHPIGTAVLTDSKGNTWTTLSEYGSQADVDNIVFFCYSPIVGSGHTFTYTTQFNNYSSMEVQAWSGVTTAAVNTSAGATTTSTGTAQPGSITPSVAHTLVISGVCFNDNSAGAVSINSGYTITDTVPFTGGLYYGSSMAYKILTSASAQNPTWNVTNSTTFVTSGITAFAY